MDTSFYLAWACLLGAPPLAIGAFFIVRRQWPRKISTIVLVSAFVMLAVLGFTAISTSFTPPLANVASICAAYLAYCFLSASCWNIRLIALRIPVLIVASIPIAIGYLMGTIGFLGLVFIVGDYSRPPLQTTQMADNLICRVTIWGMAATDSGYTVHAFRRWPGLPFIETEVVRVVVNETNSASTPANASCSDAFADYAKNHSL